MVAQAIVDVADAALCGHPWYRLASGYVVRTEIRGTKKIMLYLHREVLGLGRFADHPIHVDHINGDRLDCRRANLRPATPAQNCQNRGANKGRTLPRGVSVRRETGRYRAIVKLRGKAHELGVFGTPEEASSRVEEWRARHMPYSADARRAARREAA